MRFDVIYADNPWKFRNEKTGGSHKSGAAQKYPVMDLPHIQRLPIPAVSSTRAVLFLWVPTSLKFSHGFTTAQCWDFRHYVTTWYWDKQKLGMGFWGRNVVEELLIFTRDQGTREPFLLQEPNMVHIPANTFAPGATVRLAAQGQLGSDLDADPSMLLHQTVGEHSDKPEDFRQMIERATLSTSKRHNLELFARRVVPGWTGIGNVVTGNDIKIDLKNLAATPETFAMGLR